MDSDPSHQPFANAREEGSQQSEELGALGQGGRGYLHRALAKSGHFWRSQDGIIPITTRDNMG
jgi:hypothetical protein